MQNTLNQGSSATGSAKDAIKDYASGGNATGHDAKLADVATRAASEVASKAAESVRGLVHEGRAAASEQIGATADWINTVTRDNPMRTLGIVAIAAVVVGLMIGRR